MARNGDNLLGLGGQRNTVSRGALRGGKKGGPTGPSAQAQDHRSELLRKLKEKNEKAKEDGGGE
ncbi:hypothetical protein BJF83_14475 [Nocardiopsis sp. CNR-923]|uniref:DUF6243 family protein n=1 Tax=Nocardiopsis sp. CNR-923 TaxID=1904965 RepID=UPI0009654F0C|nr:DUF6243 family protein [Nocardiopsis sp. CNR-923]OLT28697.1 hypothetical protein BJF83_14475 [Nocardiopsis sp. CNR-923]